jgi:hypothetical protein
VRPPYLRARAVELAEALEAVNAHKTDLLNALLDEAHATIEQLRSGRRRWTHHTERWRLRVACRDATARWYAVRGLEAPPGVQLHPFGRLCRKRVARRPVDPPAATP